MLGIATFVSMDGLMKHLAVSMGVYNAIFWRVLGTVFVAGGYFVLRRSQWPTAAAMRLHVRRALLSAVMSYLFFWGLIYVPLAEAIALSFIAPLIALYLAAVLLEERITAAAIVASLLGFAGVIVIMFGKLGQEYEARFWWGVVAVLGAAALYAYNLILQRQQAILAKPVEIAFVQTAIVLLLYLLAAPVLAVVPATEQWGEIALTSSLAFISVLFMSWAYARAETRILIPIEYTAFVWAALGGWLFFNESLTLSTVAGTTLIVLGCVIAARH